jgi:hypothetical protein
MTYELAKKLKDAGFPKESFKCFAMTPDQIKESLDAGGYLYSSENVINAPTLSELIEACGDGFENLKRDGGEWFTNYIYDRGEEYDDFAFSGDTCGTSPEEAVAKLWFGLNKK